MCELQQRFYKAFPPHPKEEVYKFSTPSTMKPTQVKCAVGSLNQAAPLPPFTPHPHPDPTPPYPTRP